MPALGTHKLMIPYQTRILTLTLLKVMKAKPKRIDILEN